MRYLVAVLLSAMFAAPAFAQMHGHPGDRSGGHEQMSMGDMDGAGDMTEMCIGHADDLGLSADQARKIKAIHREMQKKQVRFKADKQLAELELGEVLENRDFDMKQAIAAVKKISDLKTSHKLDMLKSLKDINANLSDEQFQEMKKLMMSR